MPNKSFFNYRFLEVNKGNRHTLSHIPLGFGPRYCIGIEFCYLVIKLALITVLRKYTFVQAPDTEVSRRITHATHIVNIAVIV